MDLSNHDGKTQGACLHDSAALSFMDKQGLEIDSFNLFSNCILMVLVLAPTLEKETPSNCLRNLSIRLGAPACKRPYTQIGRLKGLHDDKSMKTRIYAQHKRVIVSQGRPHSFPPSYSHNCE